MKIRKISLSCAILMVFLHVASGQVFTNLNFERAVIIPDPAGAFPPYSVYASNAIPGWTAVGYGSPNDILYNDTTLGLTSVALQGTNSPVQLPLGGLYSIYLFGGVPQANPPEGASISQTGLVPASAVSIRFDAQGSTFFGPLQLSLNGQNIQFSAISNAANYTVYGGDVSAFAGQVAQLTFTAPPGGNNYWELDDIQFSSLPVPEPSVYSLVSVFSLLIAAISPALRIKFLFASRRFG